MDSEQIKAMLKEAGVAGAGGAGFPAYAKLNAPVDTVVLNCAECEPLLRLHRQLLARHTAEIFEALRLVAEVLGAGQVVVAIKATYTAAIEAAEALVPSWEGFRVQRLRPVYPAGDEVVLVEECTGRIVPPGGIPSAVGVTVFNVETMLNAYWALTQGRPVTHKYVTIAGAVASPVSLRAPIGAAFDELIAAAGGATISDYALVAGGPMTGALASGADVVKRTTNGILVLPSDHFVVTRRMVSPGVGLSRAMSSCCSCRSCTDLCPRHQLGLPIEPHAFMMAAKDGVTRTSEPFLNTFFCSQCGLCEMYACPQGLSPRRLIGQYRDRLRLAGVAAPKGRALEPADRWRDYRRVDTHRLTERLGLAEYDRDAPLSEADLAAKSVRIPLSQHIGTPAAACVAVGDPVRIGQKIGEAAGGALSLPVHSSIDGTVAVVRPDFIIVQA